MCITFNSPKHIHTPFLLHVDHFSTKEICLNMWQITKWCNQQKKIWRWNKFRVHSQPLLRNDEYVCDNIRQGMLETPMFSLNFYSALEVCYHFPHCYVHWAAGISGHDLVMCSISITSCGVSLGNQVCHQWLHPPPPSKHSKKLTA